MFGANFKSKNSSISDKINSSLVLYTPFNKKAADESGNEHHGTVHGATLVEDRFGSLDSAYYFDGNNWIDFGSSSDFTLNSNFTVSLWVKKPNQNFGWILWNGPDDQRGYSKSWMLVVNASKNIAFEKYGFADRWIQGPQLVDNAWTHVVIQVRDDGKTGYLYVNGICVGSNSAGENFSLLNPSSLIVGKRGPGGGPYLNGALDELRIYNRALSEQEILYLYEQNTKFAEKKLTTAVEEKTVFSDIAPSTFIREIPSNQLTIQQELGRGSFGIVYTALWQGAQVAVKQLIGQLTPELLEEFKRETKVHAQLRHPHIIALYGVCLEATKYAMVLEFMEKGSLFDVLKSPVELPWSVRMTLAEGLVSGILYLHTREIIHRDLKSLNILVDKNMQAKIADFGLAKIKHTTLSMTAGAMGSPLWMAPELFDDGTCNKRTDVYSAGIVLWEIAKRSLPYEDKSNTVKIMRYVEKGGRETIPSGTPPGFSNLITRCWAQDPESRPTIETVAQEIKEISLIDGRQTQRAVPDAKASIVDSGYQVFSRPPAPPEKKEKTCTIM